MHESDDTVLNELKKITKVLEEIKDIQISTFVQLSRLYDVSVETVEFTEGLGAILEDHRDGIIHTSEPKLRNFGAGYEEDEDE